MDPMANDTNDPGYYCHSAVSTDRNSFGDGGNIALSSGVGFLQKPATILCFRRAPTGVAFLAIVVGRQQAKLDRTQYHQPGSTGYLFELRSVLCDATPVSKNVLRCGNRTVPLRLAHCKSSVVSICKFDSLLSL